MKELNIKKSYRILDAGGGTGYMASVMAKKAKEVVVMDESANMLKKAEKYPGLTLVRARAQKIPFKNNYFDAVICTDALHHIKEIEKALGEMKRVLKKNGRLVIYEFDIRGIKGAILWIFEKLYIDNSRFIKPGELEELMKKLGISGKNTRVSDIEYMFSGRKN